MPEDQDTTLIRRRTRRQEATAASETEGKDTYATGTIADASISAASAAPEAATTPPARRRSVRATRAPASERAEDGVPGGESQAEATPAPRRQRTTRTANAAALSTALPLPGEQEAEQTVAPRTRARRTTRGASPDLVAEGALQPSLMDGPARQETAPALGVDEGARAAGDEPVAAPRRRVGRPRRIISESAQMSASAGESANSQPEGGTAPNASAPLATDAPFDAPYGAPLAEQAPRLAGAPAVGEPPRAADAAGTSTTPPAPRQPVQRPIRSTFNQGGPGRGSVPYHPGGRGVQRPGQPGQGGQGGYDQGGYPPQSPQQGNAPGAPYAPYGQPHPTYDPYGNPNTDRPQAPGRPMRGRGYIPGSPSYPSYPEQQQQGGRGYSDPRAGRGLPNDRNQQGAPGYGDQGGRNGPVNPGRPRLPGGITRTNGLHDRRGMTDGRDNRTIQRGRPGRDLGNQGNGSLYTQVPAGPNVPQGGDRYNYVPRQQAPAAPVRTVDVAGVLWLGGGHGMSPAELLDERNLQPVARLNPEDARRMTLRSGDLVRGRAEERGGRKLVVAIESVNDLTPDHLHDRRLFEQLTATFPDRRIRLEQGAHPEVSTRLIDLFAPLGFGSRALVVAPPKTGKTTLIREAAEAVLLGYPDAVVMAVLVGERPEEVTDLRARLEPRGGIVYAASFDEETERHAWLVQVAVERAKRVAESGRDAFMVLDSLTRLARAENLASRGAGRTLSGGIDAQALDTGRRAFGAARNLDEGGSITILATCLVDTGSRQDDVVYEEFKGTGNMELHLSRELSQRRLFPAVDVIKSSTRREEMLLTPDELRASTALRRRLADLPPQQALQQLLNVLERTPSNAALLQALEQSGYFASTTR